MFGHGWKLFVARWLGMFRLILLLLLRMDQGLEVL